MSERRVIVDPPAAVFTSNVGLFLNMRNYDMQKPVFIFKKYMN